MKYRRFLLCIGAALLFMGILFRPGCRIIVNGTVMPGIYEPDIAAHCAYRAQHTAQEILRTAESPPFQIVPVLCLRHDTAEETLLYHVLLESYEGVEKLYAVSVGGREIGLVSSLREISRLRRAYPNTNLRFTETYTYAGAESNINDVHQALLTLEEGLAGPF